MTASPIPDDIRELLLKSIDTVAQLEALLFLRSQSGAAFDVRSLAQRLFAPEPEIEAAMARLQRDGFVKEERGAYYYDAPPSLTEKVDRLAANYRQHLIPITNMIHSKPAAARTFSDAFRFRKG